MGPLLLLHRPVRAIEDELRRCERVVPIKPHTFQPYDSNPGVGERSVQDEFVEDDDDDDGEFVSFREKDPAYGDLDGDGGAADEEDGGDSGGGGGGAIDGSLPSVSSTLILSNVQLPPRRFDAHTYFEHYQGYSDLNDDGDAAASDGGGDGTTLGGGGGGSSSDEGVKGKKTSSKKKKKKEKVKTAPVFKKCFFTG